MNSAWRVLVVLSVLAVGLLNAAPTLAQSEEEGEVIYDQSCAACHQSGGVGLAPTFPPLAGNPRAADGPYVEDAIRNGVDGELEVGGVVYAGQMPPLPQLSDADIASVVLYVQSIAGTTPVTPPPTTAPTNGGSGDAANGEALFAGSVSLSERGPACYSCHEAGTYSQGGAGLGPDLTHAFSRLGGQAGLSGWLANPPSATMQPLFADRTLTGDEIADLTAFLASTDGTNPEGTLDGFLIGGLAGFLALLAVVAFAFRGPSRTYMDRLRSKA